MVKPVSSASSVIVRPCSIAEMESSPNIAELLDAYAGESAIEGLPTPSASFPLYKQLETAGALSVFAAFIESVVIGFITLLAPVNPHYNARLPVVESFFVIKKHRKSGAGLKLLQQAENWAKSISTGLLISAPFGSDLDKVLAKRGYKQTNSVYFKGVA